MGEDLSTLSHAELVARAKWYENKFGPYISSRGAGNWKNLFRKPNSYEWVILIMLMFTLLGAYAYAIETQQARNTLDNLPLICEQLYTENNQLGLSMNLTIINNSNPSIIDDGG